MAEQRAFVFEHRVRRVDGQWRLFAITAVPLLELDGRVREWVGVHTDITDERAARDELRQLNEQLEARVRAEVEVREATQVQLAQTQRLEALGQLAGGIAHDFNNVLQAVQAAAALMQRRADDPVARQRLLRMVLDAARRGASVTRRLLSFSRRGELRAEPVDAAAMLTDLSELLRHTVGCGIVVTMDAEAGLPPVMADKGQLETVLINLATNARDAMPEGGTLHIQASADLLEEGGTAARPVVLAPGEYVRLAVRDTGLGMDAATLARASEPFFTTKPTGVGTGLGLAMARGFARQSGGALQIDSALGVGTTATLWLPGGQVQAQPAQPKPRAPAVVSGQARVLLTDDDDLVRQSLAEGLQAAGFDVTAAADAQAALRVLEEERPVDLLISDLSMVGLDGISLIREAQRLLPELPAILLTGFASEAAASAMSSRITGRFSLLRKPVDAAELTDRIAMLLAPGSWLLAPGEGAMEGTDR